MKTILSASIIAILLWIACIALSFADRYEEHAVIYYLLAAYALIGTVLIVLEILRINKKYLFLSTPSWMIYRKRSAILFLSITPVLVCWLFVPLYQNCLSFVHPWLWVAGYLIALSISSTGAVLLFKNSFKTK